MFSILISNIFYICFGESNSIAKGVDLKLKYVEMF